MQPRRGRAQHVALSFGLGRDVRPTGLAQRPAVAPCPAPATQAPGLQAVLPGALYGSNIPDARGA